jgi:hypothetical protein
MNDSDSHIPTSLVVPPGGDYRWNSIWAVKQVILSPSLVKTSASTVYFPYHLLAMSSTLQSLWEAYRRDLLGEIHILCQAHVALVERALQVNLANGFAQIGLLVDQGDQTVFDLKVHFGALFDFLFKGSGSFDGQSLAAKHT